MRDLGDNRSWFQELRASKAANETVSGGLDETTSSLHCSEELKGFPFIFAEAVHAPCVDLLEPRGEETRFFAFADTLRGLSAVLDKF